MLDKLRSRCNKLKLDSNDSKYEVISKLLENDNVFFEVDVNTAISILLDLGFTEKEALKLYIELTSNKYYEGE